MNIFSSSYKDMSRIGPTITERTILLYLDVKPIKQKLYQTKSGWVLKRNEEVQNQLDVVFLKGIKLSRKRNKHHPNA